MIPTPDLSHLRPADYEHVYEPAEDTFILLDALEQDEELLKSIQPRVALEIGSGSGCASSFLGSITGPSSVLYLCTDINTHACSCTQATGRQNKIPLDSIHTSLSHPFLSRLRHSVDIILFNPPYVPTHQEEAFTAQTERDIGGAWAGGADGMQVTERFFPQVAELLSPRGRFYLVAVAQNDVPAIQRRMRAQYGLDSEIVLKRRAGREHLSVVRFQR
ncbi:S-adenosyl-L-methionine-dependent methyltransferase [Roridomyces roridus]|uniref:S-adenosyl-L-methionine-dependent methyltransferase n=1 Tax=Roridomyces roridus TaxID=1738132 RepID=A0AAD7CJ58_9AGAR|nr:S-adenosyl-L-methionine-dependent methyltransferase [Roridomyces roridus]